MPPDADEGDRREPGRPKLRRALYAATVLVPLGGAAVLVATSGDGVLAPISPVQLAAAQQPPPADEAAPQPEPGPAVAAPAPAPASAPAPADAGTASALQVLLDQASFWSAQQKYDQALASLNRALKLAPDSPDGLALLAQVQSARGDKRAAAVALDRLKQVAPGDARVARIEQAIRVGPISQDQLAEARRLAQSGRQAEAIQRYNSVFKGNPPPDALAVEYYQTLAGAQGGYDQAREALARLVRQNPQDLPAQLAYAQVLTYRESNRLEGIQRLTALAQNPSLAEQATQSWRQALGWLPDTKDSAEPLQAYLATHPSDSELTDKLAQVKNPSQALPEPARARIAGFDALNKGRLGDAEKLFQQAVDADANDADATGGLGLVRLRQRNMAEAKTLLARAIALDPEHKGRWQSALAAASNPGGGANPAVAMISHGELAAAQRELARQSAQGGDVTGLQAMLADAQAQKGQLEQAEATYRAALSRAPNNAQILVGLAGVLSREGRGQEASDLLARAQAAGGNSRQVGQARALQLREAAKAITDPATQVALYREAVAADPESPWLRLDLARALFKQGQQRQARDVMADVVGTSPTPDALKAGIIFANETSDPDAAAALVARLPPSMRTPDMLALQTQANLQREIGATLLMSRPVARQRLLEMAAQPDLDGARGAAVARALGGIGDRAAARNAVIAAQASTPGQTASAKLRYASALMDIDDPSGAQDMLATIGAARGLSAADRQQVVQLQAGLAVRSSDRLNEQGRQADAYDRLAPLLAQAPDNPDLNLALARLYQGARNPREALQISQSLLRRDPNNVEARKGAVEAALQMGDRQTADTLVRDGMQTTPNDPKVWMMSADLEKARGNNGRALRDLERARELRLQQLGYSQSDAGADLSPQPGVSLVPGAAPSYQRVAPPRPVYPKAPSADGGADQAGDLSIPPVARDYQPFRQPPAPPAPPPQPASPFSAAPAPSFGRVQGYYANPFRQGGGDTLSDAAGPIGTAATPDPVTQEIDRDIVALRDTVAPSMQGGFGFRNRSGQSGLDELNELTVPMEATFSPGGHGQLKLVVTPTILTSGSLGGGITGQQQFGTNALGLRTNAATGITTLATGSQGDQNANGLGLDVSYTLSNVTADIGSTPFGFRQESVVGGMEWAPRLSDRVRLRLLGERRAVNDSLLSYAGTVDTRTGERWGGVTQEHGRATLEFSAGHADFYLLGGVAAFSGTHVQHNTEFEAGAGGSAAVYRTTDQEVRVGLDLIYFGYHNNQDFFTLGQGGYFSPQSFTEALVPVSYKEKVDDDFSYEIGAAAGVASYRQDAQPYYPIDSALQAQLVAQQSGPDAVPGVLTEFASRSQSGFAANAHGTLDYQLSSNVHLGAKLYYEHSPAYDETTGLVYAKYLFNGTGQ